jgi:RHS repeat-associated protein
MGKAANATTVGNRVVLGSDPANHYLNGSGGASPTDPTDPSTAGAEHIVQAGISYAGAVAGATGAYFTTDRCDPPGYMFCDSTEQTGTVDVGILNMLSTLGQGFGPEDPAAPCGGSVQFIAANPAFANVTDTDVQGWFCSAHFTFPTYPPDWQPIAVATDTTNKPTCGTDPYTSTTACGEAYILVAGQGVTVTSPDLSVAPIDGADPVGANHTVTATVTNGGAPAAGQTVTFAVTGQNSGATGTCVPADCTTNSGGQVAFTYADGKGAGQDTINATVTLSGTTEHAVATETWSGGVSDERISAAPTAIHATEGAQYSAVVATLDDPDPASTPGEYTATISWGDGATSPGVISGAAGSFTITGTHTYDEEGLFPVTVTATDTTDATNVANAFTTANVQDASLHASCTSFATSSTLFNGTVATFSDADPAGTIVDYNATIDWGDGTSTAGTITGNAGGPFTVTGSHVYPTFGAETPLGITTTITDIGGATAATQPCPIDVGTGIFVIGDQVPTNPGASVTFWGMRWDKTNPRSSCEATYAPDFKGYATASAPQPTSRFHSDIRLGEWRTVNGNGPSPPTQLPKLITVGVTNCVRRQGASVSGPIVRTILVAPDAGYSPDPNVADTGTVVSDQPLTAPKFTSDNPPADASTIQGYAYNFAATGTPDATFSLASGALPDGVTLDPMSGLIDGTPTAGGTFTFAIRASNGVVPDAVTPPITIVVAPAEQFPHFTADTPPTSARVGNPYSYTFAASSTPAPTFSISSGALPDGLVLDPTTGALTGTPTAAGTFTFDVTASNGDLAVDADTGPITIVVLPAFEPISFTSASPPSTWTVGNPYAYTFAASGVPAPTFMIASGSLPPGVTLDPTTGLISGTPTTIGAFSFAVTASNGFSPAVTTPALSVAIEPVSGTGTAPTFIDDTPPTTGIVGQSYSYTFTASGNPAPTFSINPPSNLPPGLSLDPNTGVLSGTPTAAAAGESLWGFSVVATNAFGTASVFGVSLSFTEAPRFVTDFPPSAARVDASYSYGFSAEGSPAPTYTVASGALPDGLTLTSGSNGNLSGFPTTPGTFTFTVAASNGVAPDAIAGPFTIVVVDAPHFTADSPPTDASVGVPFNYTFAATGAPPPMFSLASGALPDGLKLNATTGTVSGSPTTEETAYFAIKASNGVNPPAFTSQLSIAVGPSPTPVTFTADTPPNNVVVGDDVSYQFSATGTPTPTYAITSGNLPDGLTLQAANGGLSGTATTPGTFTFDIQASNGFTEDTATVTMTVLASAPEQAPLLTADTPPNTAALNGAYSYTFAATGTPILNYYVASGMLPPGLTLDTASGKLSGAATQIGLFTFTVGVTNFVPPDAISPGITIAVLAPPGPPTAGNELYTMTTGTELDVPAPGVLADATAYDPRLPLTAAIENDIAQGDVLLHPDGSFSYVPPPGFVGSDMFTFVVRDSQNHVSDVAHVGITVNGGGPPTATIKTISPAADTTITGPTPITATLVPPPGQTITSWTVSYRRPDDSTLVQLATGTGPNVSTNFDPTLLRDGTYDINVHAVASGGGVLDTDSGLIVDGTYKPGRYSTTFQDLNINAANIPINLQRTYDSVDKTQGDFGVGWRLDFADFRIDTNGALGNGGWSDYTASGCPGANLLGIGVCYPSLAPHVVTITWPDGHVERFNFTPTAISNIAPTIAQPTFTAEPGTTSTLQVPDDSITLIDDSFHVGSFFNVGDVYDPLQYILTTKDGTQYTLDRHLGLLGVKDRNGNTLTIDDSGVHSSSGPSVTFNRDGENRIAQIVGPTGNIDYTYSPAGDLTGVHYPNGTTQAFTYDGQHDLLSTSGDGQVVRTLHYDSAGRLIAVTDGNGNTSTISTNVAGHQQVFTDATGQLTTVNIYDDRGDLIQQDRVAAGHSITTKATFDGLGRQLSSTDGDGHTTSETLDAAGNVLTQTDANGNTTSYTYNSFGEPLTVTDPLGRVTTNGYDANGNHIETDAPNGAKTTYTYDSAGHLRATTDPTGRVASRMYDPSGQLSTTTDAGGNTTHQTVDAATGRVTSITDAIGASTTFGYDADGNLIRVTDTHGGARTATYDAFDRVTSLTDPSGAAVNEKYDAAGNLTSVIDRDGETITYGYDAASRLVMKSVPGAGTTTYTYDPFGRRTAAANTVAHLTFTYDDADQMLGATSVPATPDALPTSTFTYSYDPAGNVIAQQGPGGKTAYAYDKDVQLSTLTDPAGGSFVFDYNSVGHETSMTRPNGISDSATYDAATNLTALRSTLGSTIVNQANYGYNAAGTRDSYTNTAGTTTYGYDADNQLTSATPPAASGLAAESYSYDALGNRISTSTSPLGSFSYDNANRLVSDAGNTYTYDNEGDLLSRTNRGTGAKTVYTWTAEHQLINVTYPDNTSSAFRYDPLGRRVEITDGGNVTRYSYDNESIAAEYDDTNSLTASYVHDPRDFTQSLEMVRRGQRYFYLADGQHSTTALTDINGIVVDTYKYDAFGDVQQTGTVVNPFTYGGQFFDQTATLLLFPLRVYDASLGRFLTEDPAPSLNPYVYAEDSPINSVDPTGALSERTGLILAQVNMALGALDFSINVSSSFWSFMHGDTCQGWWYLASAVLAALGGAIAFAGVLGKASQAALKAVVATAINALSRITQFATSSFGSSVLCGTP